MFTKFWQRAFRRGSRRPQPVRNKLWRGRPSLGVEALGDRIAPAILAFFSAQSHVLTVLGDNLDNTITVSRDAAGAILVNGGAVSIKGGTPTVANTSLIQVLGQGGNDLIALNETNGALPSANLFGGNGNDTLTGGSGADLLFGQAGNDVLLGKGGVDFLFGGANNDVLTGGTGDDQVFGEAGNDRMIWNPGEDSDLNEGGDGIDTVEVNGGNGAEVFTITANGNRVRFDRISPAPFFIDIGTSENLVVNANGGDDTIDASGLPAGLIQLTANGGAGNDQILGSQGVDVLLGGDGNDFIDGNQGNDLALMGAGNDVFQWDPGDGSDIVEGQDGFDTMLFNGSGANEIFEASANGERVRFTRNVGNIVMDLNDVERIDLNTLGGTDTTTINDLSGTDVVEININQAGTIGGTAGDAAADTVIVNGTNGDDIINVVGAGTSVSVVGLPVLVNVTNSEGANDQLVVNALAGNDTVNASTLVAGIVKLTVDGGAGDDTILGSRGNDMLLGGDGDDFIDGNQGDDLMIGGAGNDVLQWDPGDGNDVLEGGDGFDTMLFNGNGANEIFEASANGERVRFTRNVGNIVMDLNDVESIDLNALGGTDTIVINDLSGTDVTEINLDLSAVGGGGDGQPDTVIVKGTNGDDVIVAAGDANGVSVLGLAVQVNITGAEAAIDRLIVDALAGDDVVDGSGLAAGAIQFAADGGDGDDVLVGGAGNDTLTGGAGDDVLIGGLGQDVLSAAPGSDIVIQ